MDASGNVFVADTGNNRIQKFASDGLHLLSWGADNSTTFSSPADIAVDTGDNVYVADTGNSRIQKFNNNGVPDSSWVADTSITMSNPNGIAVDALGNVFVADTGNNRIHKFASNGSYLLSWGADNSITLTNPGDIAVDADDNVYVADTGNNRIQKFDPTTGLPVVTWGEEGGSVPILLTGESLITGKRSLPNIKDQCSVNIIYDQSHEEGETGRSATLHEVLSEKSVPLTPLPGVIKQKPIGGNRVIFKDLPPHLIDRVEYDEFNHLLIFKGTYDDSFTGEPLLLTNIMSERERDTIKKLEDDPIQAPDDTVFKNAVESLYLKTTENLQGELGITGPDEFKILTAGSPRQDLRGTGYVTLAFNDDEDICGGDFEVMVYVIRVGCDLYKGELKILEPENVFDERVTFRHSGDFGGEPGPGCDCDDEGPPCCDDLEYEWEYCIETQLSDCSDSEWLTLKDYDYPDEPSVNDVTIGGQGIATLQDKWIRNRYRGYDRSGCPTGWSAWTRPQLYENWIKRVVKQINPFEQRYKNFRDHEAATYVSMLQQAGGRYEGDVALGGDLDGIGLIELYETLLRYAMYLSIDKGINDPNVNNTILFATSRIADLYMLLGNEAYADASDPTIGFTTHDNNWGTAAPRMFCFKNVVPSLLSEELELLRGRDDSRLPDHTVGPYYNRLIWNFTTGDGETAYVENYGVETTEQASAMYPQAHGDAWGHYLMAIKKYYSLLRHEHFGWIPRSEAILVAGEPVEVDYLDERKFASIAAAKARAGAEIVNLTYREKYVDDPAGQWQGYKDTDTERAWGLSEWATRAGQGAYFDWVVGNALLPYESNEEGIRRIDRQTVLELQEVASSLGEIQLQLNNADRGLNPLGLAKDAIPFDISPAEVDQGKTHFEQIYERAVQVLNNAIVVFNYANQSTQMLRKQQETLEDFENNVEDREADFDNRLIEIFGYPYSDDIGTGKTYEAGYEGPDLYHYSYVDTSALLSTQLAPVQEFTIEVTDFTIDDDGRPVEETKDIEFHLSTEGLGLIKPTHWTGRRKAPGEIQMARSDLMQAKARFERARVEYDNLLAQIEDEAETIEAQENLNSETIDIRWGMSQKQQTLNNAIKSARKREMLFRTAGRLASIVANAVAEALPKSAGFSTDFTSVARSGIMLAGGAVNELNSTMADAQALQELAHQQAKEIVETQGNLTLEAMNQTFAIEQMLKQLASLIRNEASLRLELHTLQENLQQASGRYLAAVARGERLLKDRDRYRGQVADNIREYRYRDMAFRTFRNDALQKYRAQFDLAARYVYLAAKAYDYDTCLLDPQKSGEKFFTNIVKQRTLGEVSGGMPMTGSGLAGPMAELYGNFTVLKGQMGFNNPILEETRFSLRKELFRILGGYASNDKWKEELTMNRVDNLWEVPEFRRFCSPFALQDPNEPEPAIVIPFSTNITSRVNFFGNDLGGGDSYYSAARFATKIRRVGVWFSNYDGYGLAETPYVYLVPVGEDIIRVPDASFDVRNFAVVDQVLPVPFPVGSGGDWQDDKGWIPGVDTLFDTFYRITRHSNFRAYHDGTNWSQQLRNADLIGRSVWNDQWLLIIPGSALYYDPDVGLDIFEEKVQDIKFLFETYAYAGGM